MRHLLYKRIAKLTSRTKENAQINIDERYQGHAKALSKAGLAHKTYSTLKEIWKKSDASKLNNDTKQERGSGGLERTTYFCTGLSKIWREKIYNIIKSFVIPAVLNGYLRGFTIIDSKT